MQRYGLSKGLFRLISLALLLSFSLVMAVPVRAAIINVPADYPTIQAAIVAASNGDTINVAAGTYTENVEVDKQLTLTGDLSQPGNVVVDAGGSDSAIKLTVNGCVLQGFKVQNGERGICLDSSSNTLTSNIANSNAEYGIYLDSSSNNTLAENTVSENGEHGIYLDNSDSNTLTSNIANSNTEYGIYLDNSDSNTLTSNIANSNTRSGIYLDGPNGSNGNTLTGNTANQNSECGIYLDSSSSNTLTENTANSNTEYGIYLDNSDSNTLTSNIANSNTKHGIYLNNGSNNNTLSQNTVSENSEHGIYLAQSGSNNLTGNTMSGNSYNFHVVGSSVDDYVQTINTTNKVDGKPVYYLVGADGDVIGASTNAGYVGVVNSTNVTVKDLTLTKGGQGVLFAYTSHSSIENVTVSDNYYGIYLDGSVDASTISINFNNIYGNTEYGVENSGSGTADATNNWWGAKDGPGGVGPGTGDAVSDNVDYDPWLNALVGDSKKTTTSSGDDIIDAKTEADTELDKSGAGAPTITVAKYSSNPGAGFSGDTGRYIDVHADNTAGVDEIVIKLYYTITEIGAVVESTLTLRWWNGTGWVVCSDSGVTYPAGEPTYRGYMWAKIRSDTTPNLTQLTGSAFVGGGVPLAGGVAVFFPAISNLTTAPTEDGIAEVNIREAVIIATEVENKGDGPGSYTVTLKINGVVEEKKTVALAPWEKKTVTFTVFKEEAGTYKVEVNGLKGEFIVSELPAATFEITNFSISPAEVEAGETVTISAQVANIGGTKGICRLELKIDGIVKVVREVTLDPNESKIVSFELTDFSPGDHQVQVSGLTGELSIVPLPPAPPVPPAAPAAEPFSYGWLIAVIAAVAALAALAFIIAIKRLQPVLSTERGWHTVRKRLQRVSLERDWFEKPAKPFTTAGRRLRRAPLVEKPAEPVPRALRVGNLKITPNQVKPGETITVFAEATNTSLVTSSYSLVLKIKGIVEAVKEITLSPGQSQKVAFMILKNKPGVYDLDLEDLKGSFTVEEVAAPPDSSSQ